MLKLKNKNMKNNNPLISIITPSYNQGQFIEETIKSVQNQNYKNFEHIVIDGGSTDNTLKILKKYTGKIKWISEKDKGQSDGINKGLKMAKGDILCYLNSDDCFFPYTLEEIVNFFNSHPNFFWVTGDYILIDKNGNKIKSIIPLYKKLWSLFPYRTTLLLTNYISQPSTFWKKEVLKKIGYFNVNYKYNMDFDYWARIFNAGYRLHVLNKKLSKFRIHEDSINGARYKEQFDHMLFLIKKYSNSRIIYYFNKLHYGLIKIIYSLRKI